jgi:ferritin-like metal-binding protein YciE
MAGLVEEAEQLLGDTEDPMVRDAALVCAAQKIEHYEIGSYGSVCAYAKILGEKKAADLLSETLEEEKDTDALLTQMAEGWINEVAKQHV